MRNSWDWYRLKGPVRPTGCWQMHLLTHYLMYSLYIEIPHWPTLCRSFGNVAQLSSFRFVAHYRRVRFHQHVTSCLSQRQFRLTLSVARDGQRWIAISGRNAMEMGNVLAESEYTFHCRWMWTTPSLHMLIQCFRVCFSVTLAHRSIPQSWRSLPLVALRCNYC